MPAETAPATGAALDERERARLAADFLAGYSGDFGFLRDLRVRVARGTPLSAKQVDAVLRCRARDPRGGRPVAAPPQAGLDLTRLPAGVGRYAIIDATGTLVFLRIDNLGEGTWGSGDARPAGWVFVKRFFGGGRTESLGRQRPGGRYEGEHPEWLRLVLGDPIEAGLRFGRELGVCGRCGLPLTTEASRLAGIGPDCRKALA